MNRFQVSVIVVAILGCVSPWLGLFSAIFASFFFLLSETPKSTKPKVTIKDLEEARKIKTNDTSLKVAEFVEDFRERYNQKILRKIAASSGSSVIVCVSLPTWAKLNYTEYLRATQDEFKYAIWTGFPGFIEIMF